MEKEESSYSHHSDEDYEEFQIKRESSPFDDQSNDDSHSNDDDYNSEQKSNSSIDYARILSPPGVESNIYDDCDVSTHGQTANSNQPKFIVTAATPSNAKKRPRILAPPRSDSSSDADENDNGKDDNHTGCIVNFQTRRGRKVSRDVNGHPLPRNRFLVRTSCSRSASPLRQVIVDRPLNYDCYSRKCRNYEASELGYCLVGNNCPYLHGPNTIVVNDITNNAMNNPSFNANNGSGGVPFSAQPPQSSAKRQPTCSLLIRKIPPACANIAKINEYFGRFGVVQHIQVSFGGRADEALIRYVDVESAVRAYRCQEPIFCNRFVNLRWWYDEDAEPSAARAQHAFGSTFFIPPPTASSTVATSSQYKNDSAAFRQSRNLSKTFSSTASGRNVTYQPQPLYRVDGAGTTTAVSSRPSAQPLYDDGIDTTAVAVAGFVRTAKQSRGCTTLRSLSKRFAARTERSLELKTLGTKTDLYLKLSEQVRIVLLNAKAATDSTARQRWLKIVGELQANMHELSEGIRQLYASIYPGRRILDVGAIVGRTASGTQAV